MRKSLLLALASLLLGLVLAEALLRVFRPQTLGLSMLSEDGLVLHMPGHRALYRREEFTVETRFNALGFRGPEFAVPKPEGTFRILALGDSFTEGLQVEEEDLFTTRIERALRGTTPRVEVLNLGVSGMGTDDELELLRLFGPRLEPDLVLVFYCLQNDTENVALNQRCRLVEGLLACDPLERPSRARLRLAHAKAWAGSRLHLYQLLRAATAGEFFQRVGLRAEIPDAMPGMPFGHDLYRAQEPAYLTDALALIRELLRALRDEAADLGAESWLVLVPARDQVEDARWRAWRGDDPTLVRDRPQQAVRAIGQALGMPVIDLLPALRAREAAGEHPYWRIDGHFTATGHAITAAEVVAALELRDPRRGSLP